MINKKVKKICPKKIKIQNRNQKQMKMIHTQVLFQIREIPSKKIIINRILTKFLTKKTLIIFEKMVKNPQ